MLSQLFEVTYTWTLYYPMIHTKLFAQLHRYLYLNNNRQGAYQSVLQRSKKTLSQNNAKEQQK